MIKLSIIWDEKKLKGMNSEEFLKEMSSIYAEYQKELAATSASANGSIFIGLATETDTESIKSLLNLPSDVISALVNYIRTSPKSVDLEKLKENINLENGITNEKQNIKELLLASPHKEIELMFDRSNDIGREINL